MEEKTMSLLYRFLWGLSLPANVNELRGRTVLHFSDTPSTFYGGMRRLIRLLEPLCVVHTGDLADDVKLELYPGELPRYRRKLRALADVLLPVEKNRLVIVTGNHDHEESVREFFSGSSIFHGSGRIEMCGLELNLSHDMIGLKRPHGRFNLFGHDLAVEISGEGLFLNGLRAIHALHVETGEVSRLSYPGYVNDARLVRRRIGL